ncbi:Plant pleckstrin region [Musa troglodytarum]|uniref:Plant pleckstrin region n=1 Tax=Musa troglodytarum TaxID=320322 RepID=A0A9E7FXT4_9LILI|nr:Plant pleckstrin region [Musa troglodytarum]
MHMHIKRSFPRRRIVVFFKNVYNSSKDARDEKMEKLEERGEIELCKEKSQLSTYYCPSEVLKSPNDAMEFLSRTWSPSSSDFSQMLSSNGREHDQGLQKQQTEESLVHFEEDDKTRLEQAVTLLSAGNLVRSAAGKLKQLHFGCMNVGQMKAWLGVELFSSFSRGCREKRKEKVRLREAQVHAALSVTRLAAAIAGFSANSRLEPTNAKCTSVTGMGGGALDEKMNAVVASAAALVATVCAEAAESVGANRERVACMHQKTLARGARLPVRMPEGKVRQRLVYIFRKRDKLTVRLRKKHIRGVFSTYTEC